MKIIGIIGLSGAGKDTLAGIIADELGDALAVDSYAAPLREFTSAIFGFDCAADSNRDRRFIPQALAECRAPHVRKAIERLAEALAPTPGVRRDTVLRALHSLHSHAEHRMIHAKDYMLLIGDGMLDTVGQNIWVDRLLHSAKRRDVRVTIASDVREPNERAVCDHILYVERDMELTEAHKSPKERVALAYHHMPERMRRAITVRNVTGDLDVMRGQVRELIAEGVL